MTVTRKIDDNEPELIPDVNRVLEIEVECDLSGKFNPVVVREHEGKIAAFEQLDEKPADEFKDGTYFVDIPNNKIWVYAQYFSKYSIAYLTKSQVISVKPKATATPKPTAASGKNDKNGGSSNAKSKLNEDVEIRKNPDGTYTYVKKAKDNSVPETGDGSLPIVWIWALMLGTGVAMLSFLFSKRMRRDDE